jgi:hypothetical protein
MAGPDYSTLLAVLDGYTSVVIALFNVGMGLVSVALVVSGIKQILPLIRGGGDYDSYVPDDRDLQEWFVTLSPEDKAANGVKTWEDLRDLW